MYILPFIRGEKFPIVITVQNYLADGSLLVGYGPFSLAAMRPENGVAFYVNDFALSHEIPWRVPHHWEILRKESIPRPALPQTAW